MTKRETVLNKRTEVSTKAADINAWYVLCAFISPITKDVCFRVGYFEERHDAEQWVSTLVKRYTDLQVKHYIVSNTLDHFLGDASAFND